MRGSRIDQIAAWCASHHLRGRNDSQEKRTTRLSARRATSATIISQLRMQGNRGPGDGVATRRKINRDVIDRFTLVPFHPLAALLPPDRNEINALSIARRVKRIVHIVIPMAPVISASDARTFEFIHTFQFFVLCYRFFLLFSCDAKTGNFI